MPTAPPAATDAPAKRVAPVVDGRPADPLEGGPPVDTDPSGASVVPTGPGVKLATALGALAAFWGLMIGIGPLGDNSFFTHLETGRLILADGRIPTGDPYSFTAHGDPWVVQSWLASVLFAGLDDVGGFAAIRMVVGLTTGALALLVWHLCRPAE